MYSCYKVPYCYLSQTSPHTCKDEGGVEYTGSVVLVYEFVLVLHEQANFTRSWKQYQLVKTPNEHFHCVPYLRCGTINRSPEANPEVWSKTLALPHPTKFFFCLFIYLLMYLFVYLFIYSFICLFQLCYRMALCMSNFSDEKYQNEQIRTEEGVTLQNKSWYQMDDGWMVMTQNQ